MDEKYSLYRNYNNGKLYRLLFIATDHETDTPMAVYCSDENPDGLRWIRTAREFHAKFKRHGN